MEKASKEMLREFVNNPHFTSTTEIMNNIKKLFSNVLQQVMEAEMVNMSPRLLVNKAEMLTAWRKRSLRSTPAA